MIITLGKRWALPRLLFASTAARTGLFLALFGGTLAALFLLVRLNADFLGQRAGFQISESLITAGAESPLWRSLLAGLLNTLIASFCAALLALSLGMALAILRTAPLKPARWLAALVIEPLRNTPVLLQLFLWYGIVTEGLPGPREALRLPLGAWLCNRGLFLPWIGADGLEWPALHGFNISGGLALSPEFTVLVFGLGLFHACYLAEIFRAGLQAVPKRQIEAGTMLSLPAPTLFLHIVLPQALGFALPAVTVQVLMIVKNSALAVAIGYPDFVSVLNTAVNQNGRALQGLAITILIFLSVNAVLAFLIEQGGRLIGIGARQGNLTAAPSDRERRGSGLTGKEWLLLAVLAALLAFPVWEFLRWAILDAVWSGPANACRDAAGACWAVVWEKRRLLLFGLYPAAEQNRALAALVLALLFFVLVRADRMRHPRFLIAALAAILLAWFWLLGGGLGLTPVPSSAWGGMSLTAGLAIAVVFAGLILSLPLALARRSPILVLRAPAAALIEIFRSTPLVALLLAADLVIPTLLPPEMTIDKIGRAFLAIALLASVNLAEVLRGALNSIASGQTEAARTLGLSRAQSLFHVILPQAAKIALPASVNVFIGAVKDTSLVLIVGIIDVTGAAKAAVADPEWRAFSPELYLILATIYFALCFPIARIARKLEG